MKRILIIQTAFLGDVVLATGLIEKLNHFYPETEIDFLVRKGNESVLEGHPTINELLIFNKSEKITSLLATIKYIRSKNYDLVVNLQRFLSSGIIAAFSKGKSIVGFDKNPMAFLYHQKMPHVIDNKGTNHEVDRNHALIAQYTDNVPAKPKLYPSIVQFKKVAELKTEPYLTVAPASIWFTKQWPEVKWIELLDVLKEYQVFLLGAPSDTNLCERIKEKTMNKSVVNLAGKLKPLESVALMRDAVMNYVNDSAPLHFASAVNAPTTAIFNSTVPEFGFGPLSDKSLVVQTSEELNCRPCGLHGFKECPEGHFKCANEIMINQVDVPKNE